MRDLLSQKNGFTLVELSIVLVIIGLIVGGVLVGQDLIRAAAVRATITQIEKYNTAVNTFRGKYGYLPGDIKDPEASSFGLTARGQYAGQGDGNGVIEGCTNNAPSCNAGFLEGAGETVMFWKDLTPANGLNGNLIEGSFSAANPTSPPASISGAALNGYFPVAKLGQENYFYVYSTGPSGGSGINYFGLSVLTAVNDLVTSTPGLTVNQANQIDKKIDDGLPQSGNVIAIYLDGGAGFSYPLWAAGGGSASSPNIGYNWNGNPSNSATSGSSTTCYDNGNVNGATQQYSMTQNGGAGVNCALSFQFQ